MITLKESIYNFIGKLVDRSVYNYVWDSHRRAVHLYVWDNIWSAIPQSVWNANHRSACHALTDIINNYDI